MSRVISMILTLCIAVVCSGTVYAASEDYNYTTNGPNEPAPTAYELERSIRAVDLGVPDLKGLTSIFATEDKVYIADVDKIIVTDHNFNTLKVLSEYQVNGKTQVITNPAGIYVTEKGDLYVTEPDNSRILQFDNQLTFVRELLKPEIIGMEDVVYKPVKIVVNEVGRMYVVARNVYEGILEFNPDGTFSRFFGVNEVKFNPIDLFWRSIATEQQRAQMELWLPTDFSSIALDDDGFVFSTSKGSEEINSLKKINSQGKDILRFPEKMRPMGDVLFDLSSSSGAPVGPSDLIAVDCNDIGMYTVLDAKRMRVFTYNEDGNLLYIFGGNGTTEGKFQNPVDVKFMGYKMLVVDQQAQTIEVMKPTVYAQSINEAVELQYSNSFQEAAAKWEIASELNPNLELPYVGIGKTALRQDEYSKATNLFKLGQDREYYSKAFEKYREEFLANNFGYIVAVIVGLIVLVIVVKIFSHRKKRKGLK